MILVNLYSNFIDFYIDIGLKKEDEEFNILKLKRKKKCEAYIKTLLEVKKNHFFTVIQKEYNRKYFRIMTLIIVFARMNV